MVVRLLGGGGVAGWGGWHGIGVPLVLFLVPLTHTCIFVCQMGRLYGGWCACEGWVGVCLGRWLGWWCCGEWVMW